MFIRIIAATLLCNSLCFFSTIAIAEVSPKSLTVVKNVGEVKKGKLISKVVGEVAGHFVTSREVQLNYLIESTLGQTEKNFYRTVGLTIGNADFQRELNGVFLEWVVDLEAKEFSITKILPKDFSKALNIVEQRLPKHKIWNDIKANNKEIKKALQRKMRAKKFIRFKVESSVVGITDEEARKYYELNEGKFGKNSFEGFKKNIKAFLKKRKMNERLADWFAVLQKKYKVQSFVSIKK